ncbi:MAG TPA: ribonuclease D [Luteolibacter sp.]|nr:ribonuclease D [Luteolibacter sp.]
MIETSPQLIDFLELIRRAGSPPVCAVDTEADSLHRYQESLCLVQMSAGGHDVLIDPLAIKDLSPLGEFLSGATVWMHGADYDMTMLKREFGSVPAVVYDTQIGARLLGARRFGLGDLVEQYFGVTLSKSSQKADWGKRPLSDKMVEYALNDVHYLLEMGGMIVGRLRDLGRYEWFVESCDAARQKVLERNQSAEDAWRIQGSGKLTRRGLAFLKELWQWRDDEARGWDRPTFMVIPNRVLLEWCEHLAQGGKVALPKHYRPDRVRRFHLAREAAAALEEDQCPAKIKTPRTKRAGDFDQKLERFIKARDKAAASLDIEGSLIAPRAALEAIAGGQAEPAELLLKWQLGCLEL